MLHSEDSLIHYKGCPSNYLFQLFFGGGRVVKGWAVLLIWIIVGQGPVALAVGAGGGCFDIFSLIYPFSPLSPSL